MQLVFTKLKPVLRAPPLHIRSYGVFRVLLRAWGFHGHRPSPFLPPKLNYKVMHDAHDHAVALARLLEPGPQTATPTRGNATTMIKSLLDLQLAYESLGGCALNSFGDALWSLGLCQDPRRYIIIHTIRIVCKQAPFMSAWRHPCSPLSRAMPAYYDYIGVWRCVIVIGVVMVLSFRWGRPRSATLLLF